jgi:uncharacterized paraquat-inducible protein A
MTDEPLTMPNGAQYLPATTRESKSCTNCDNIVDTPEELLSYPSGNCPQCGNPWTGAEPHNVEITVTMPVALGGGTM